MDTEKKLIYLVQQYGCLYNIQAKDYCDRYSKSNAWDKVCKEMNLSVEECQKKWKKIRDCYRKALKLRKKYSECGSAAIKNKPIKFEKELKFLKPYVFNRTQDSETEENITDTDFQYENTPQSMNSPSLPAPSPQLSNNSRNKQNLLKTLKMSQKLYKDYIAAKKHEDPSDSFFLTMSRKVKKMPKKIQAEIERDIFRIVNEAEIKLAEDNLTSLYVKQHAPSTSHIPSNSLQLPIPTTEETAHTPSESYLYIPSNTYSMLCKAEPEEFTK